MIQNGGAVADAPVKTTIPPGAAPPEPEPEPESSVLETALKIVLLTLLAFAVLAAAGFAGYHRLVSAKSKDFDALARLAETYLETDSLSVVRTEQRDDYLAALCQSEKGGWYLCEFERDWIWHGRWRAGGGKKKLPAGELSSWNYRSPKGDAVLIFCAYRLHERHYWYTFRNDGITYICPVKDDPLLDIFVLPGCNDISAVPQFLGKDYQPSADGSVRAGQTED